MQILQASLSTDVIVDIAPYGGAFSINNSFSGSAEVEVVYDGNSGGLGGLDFTNIGTYSGFDLTLPAVDVSKVSISITVFDSDGDSASLTISALTVGVTSFKFIDFTENGTPGSVTNFTSVNFFRLLFALDASAEVLVDSLELR